MLTRRAVVAGLAAAPLAAAASLSELAALEASSGGRLGVAIVDTGSGRRINWRAGERFLMCSTFKLLAAGFALARADRGIEALDARVAVTAADVAVAHSPATRPHAGGTMTIGELCAAAMTVSDNGAANLLLARFGGPAALTGYVRGLGDPVTRLDRIEPDLNDAPIGDPRDTTTPATMLATLRTLVLGTALTPASRTQLIDWLVANRTGDARLRAGLPRAWRVGDKTGTADGNGTTNDVAVIWPPARAPLLVAAYLTRSPLDGDRRNAVLAAVGRIAARV